MTCEQWRSASVPFSQFMPRVAFSVGEVSESKTGDSVALPAVLSNVSIDTHNVVDSINNVVVIPFSGIYRIEAGMYLTNPGVPSVDEGASIQLVVNGGEVFIPMLSVHAGNSTPGDGSTFSLAPYMSTSRLIEFSAGDEVGMTYGIFGRGVDDADVIVGFSGTLEALN